MQEVDGVVFSHASQFDKTFVGLGVGIEDGLRDLFGLFSTIPADDMTRIREILA